MGVIKSVKLKLQPMVQEDSFSYFIVSDLIKSACLGIFRGKLRGEESAVFKAKRWSPAGESSSDTSSPIATNRKCWQELLSLVLICMHGNLFHLKEY